MLCGLTRLASRIKLFWFVLWNREAHCRPACLWCKYAEFCYGIKEEIETVYGEPFE